MKNTNRMLAIGWEEVGEGWVQWTSDETDYSISASENETGHISYGLFLEGDIEAEYAVDANEVLSPVEAFRILTAEMICNNHDLDELHSDLANEIRTMARI